MERVDNGLGVKGQGFSYKGRGVLSYKRYI